MTVRIPKDARVYLRRSTSAQESSLETQLQWAIDQARRLGIPLRATLDDLAHMQLHRLTHYSDIYLDDATSGSKTRRPAFDALLTELEANLAISHLLVFKRDRFGRPKDPLDMMVIERDIREMGVTVVMSDGTVDPATSRQERIGQSAMSLFGYYESGEYSRKLSERIVLSLSSLAAEGYSTGGKPPYGFGRFLCDANDNVIEELEPGRRVRQRGCHVRLLPSDPEKIGVWIQILEWLECEWGFKRVADELNRLGIPSPDAGCTRHDNGVEHVVSGKWNFTTIKSLAENKIITGIKVYGRYGEGVHNRLGTDGPRPVEQDELHADGSGRYVENDPSVWIEARAGGEVLFDPERWERLQEKLRARSTPESGKRKAKDPAAYPLTPRVFDLTDGCGSLMHGSIRQDRGPGTPLYRCARYMKSPRFCHHNNVNAEALLQFTLKTIAARVQRAGGAEKIRAALVARAKAAGSRSKAKSPEDALRSQIHAKVERLRQQIEQAPRRILEAEDAEVRTMMHAALRDLRAELADQEKALREVEARTPYRPATLDIDAEVQKALGVIQRIETVCGDPVAREQVPRLLSDLGVRIGLTFREGRAEKNRKVRRLQGGIIAFGNRPLPCVLRNGAGRPIIGGLAPEGDDDTHEGGCDHGHQNDQPGKARRRAGDQKTLSSRKGKSTGARGGPRGATPHSPVDSKPPRQPPETGRLSKVSRGDRT